MFSHIWHAQGLSVWAFGATSTPTVHTLPPCAHHRAHMQAPSPKRLAQIGAFVSEEQDCLKRFGGEAFREAQKSFLKQDPQKWARDTPLGVASRFVSDQRILI